MKVISEKERNVQTNIEEKKLMPKRALNFEFLRIVSMFMVLVIHFNFPIKGIPTVESWQSNPIGTSFTVATQSLVIVCVSCFILISGYFGIRWKWRSFSNLIFQIFFFLFVAYLASLFLETSQDATALFGIFLLFKKLIDFIFSLYVEE